MVGGMRVIRRGALATVTTSPPVATPRDRSVARETSVRSLRRLAGSPWLLIPIVLLALAFRLYGLKWDDGYHLHPDERFISIVITDRILPDWPPKWSTLLQPDISPLNPRSDDPVTHQPRDFAYGSLPLFVTKAVGGTMQA